MFLTQLTMGLFLVLYFAFTCFTMYLVFIGKKSPEQGRIGKLIWYHGVSWIIVMIAVAVVTLAFIFASFLLSSMGKIVPIVPIEWNG